MIDCQTCRDGRPREADILRPLAIRTTFESRHLRRTAFVSRFPGCLSFAPISSRQSVPGPQPQTTHMRAGSGVSFLPQHQIDDPAPADVRRPGPRQWFRMSSLSQPGVLKRVRQDRHRAEVRATRTSASPARRGGGAPRGENVTGRNGLPKMSRRSRPPACFPTVEPSRGSRRRVRL